jgi:ABC-type glutathione transport system ATPase component
MSSNSASNNGNAQPLLRVDGISKSYISGGRWWKRTRIEAIKGISLEIQKGRTLALIGSSGCGKSTLARCVAGLERPDTGSVRLDGVEFGPLSNNEIFSLRTRVQMVFQDAVTSLNPRFSAGDAVEEPLFICGTESSERKRIAEASLEKVGLSATWFDRPVMNFSGGQRQRLAIARALTMNPNVLVLDEALSGLDLSTQFQIAHLLSDLQKAQNLTYLLISHDMALVAGMADSIAFMSGGKIIENAPTQEFLANPQHEEAKKFVTLSREAQAQLTLRAAARA